MARKWKNDNSFKTCHRCQKGGLTWTQVGGSWRLKDKNGEIHSCPKPHNYSVYIPEDPIDQSPLPDKHAASVGERIENAEVGSEYEQWAGEQAWQ